MSDRSILECFSSSFEERDWRYGDPAREVKDTNPGTVANPTNTSCLLGKDIPICWGSGPDLVIITLVRLLSCPLHASMKNNFGLPSSVLISDTSVTRHSMFHVLLPSVHCMKLSAVP